LASLPAFISLLAQVHLYFYSSEILIKLGQVPSFWPPFPSHAYSDFHTCVVSLVDHKIQMFHILYIYVAGNLSVITKNDFVFIIHKTRTKQK
jgi:hypothetical protein